MSDSLDPMDCSLPGSSVHGILQARILEWVAVPSSRDLPKAGIEPKSLTSPALAGIFFMAPPRKPSIWHDYYSICKVDYLITPSCDDDFDSYSFL